MAAPKFVASDADERAFAALVVCVLAAHFMLPRDGRVRTVVLCGAVAAGALVYIATVNGGGWGGGMPALQNGTHKGQGNGPSRHGDKGRAGERNTVIDPELYTLRLPSRVFDAPGAELRAPHPNMSLRGPAFERSITKAASLGRRSGNAAAAAKAVAALEDFFSRYHRAMLSRDAALAMRTLATLRDTRSSALNALHDLLFCVPASLSQPIASAIEAARKETLRCLSTLLARQARRRPAEIRSALQVQASEVIAPVPYDVRLSNRLMH